MKIYVGNLERSVTEDELKELFETHGSVVSNTIIKDRYTNESRGFGFVEMSSSEEANAAIKATNGQVLKGRPLTVNEAREREPRSRDFGGGGSSSSSGFGGSSSGGRSSGGGGYSRGSEGGGGGGGFGSRRSSDDRSSRGGGYRGSSDRSY